MAKAATRTLGRRMVRMGMISVLFLCLAVVAGLGIAELYLAVAATLGDGTVAILFLALLLGTAASLIRPDRPMRRCRH